MPVALRGNTSPADERDAMPRDPLRHLEQLAARVRKADARAGELRAELYREIGAALDSGASLSAVARAIGVTRQRMQALARQLKR
jgi:hypothetical protein